MHISLHFFCLIFIVLIFIVYDFSLISYRFRWYLLQWILLSFCFCKKQKLVELRKFSLDPYLSLRWTSDFEILYLVWEVYSYKSLLMVAPRVSVLFLVLSIIFYPEIKFSQFWFQQKFSHQLFSELLLQFFERILLTYSIWLYWILFLSDAGWSNLWMKIKTFSLFSS